MVHKTQKKRIFFSYPIIIITNVFESQNSKRAEFIIDDIIQMVKFQRRKFDTFFISTRFVTIVRKLHNLNSTRKHIHAFRNYVIFRLQTSTDSTKQPPIVRKFVKRKFMTKLWLSLDKKKSRSLSADFRFFFLLAWIEKNNHTKKKDISSIF